LPANYQLTEKVVENYIITDNIIVGTYKRFMWQRNYGDGCSMMDARELPLMVKGYYFKENLSASRI